MSRPRRGDGPPSGCTKRVLRREGAPPPSFNFFAILDLREATRAPSSLSFRAPKAFGVEESLDTPGFREAIRAHSFLSFRAPKAFGVEESLGAPDLRKAMRA